MLHSVQGSSTRGEVSWSLGGHPDSVDGKSVQRCRESDLRRRGFGVAIPFGEDYDFDLVLIRDGRLERVQVKYTASDGSVVKVKCSPTP
jgi:hypothetical protein